MITLTAAPLLDHDAMMAKQFDSQLDQRMRNERRIVWNLLQTIEAAGFIIRSVDDWEERTKINARDNDRAKQAMELCFNLDDCKVYFSKGMAGHELAWVRFIFGNGNEGKDVLCDYGMNLSQVLEDFDFDACVNANLQRPEDRAALQAARRLLDSVAFVATEGDTAPVIAMIDAALGS